MDRPKKPRSDARKAALAVKRKANRAHRVDIMRKAFGPFARKARKVAPK